MTATLNPQILGQAEAAHRAVLDRILAGSGTTYPQWVTLALAGRSSEPLTRAVLQERVATALKINAGTAARAVADLDAQGLLETHPDSAETVGLSASGRRLHDDIRQDIDEIMTRVYAGLDPADLEAAGRLLLTLTHRASDELATHFEDQ